MSKVFPCVISVLFIFLTIGFVAQLHQDFLHMTIFGPALGEFEVGMRKDDATMRAEALRKEQCAIKLDRFFWWLPPYPVCK